jgi:hypothetical protein
VSGLLTFGEVARRSGIAASALRFHEERGPIASERAGPDHRRYRRSESRCIARSRAREVCSGAGAYLKRPRSARHRGRRLTRTCHSK